jgi:hypothetical protein
MKHNASPLFSQELCPLGHRGVQMDVTTEVKQALLWFLESINFTINHTFEGAH